MKSSRSFNDKRRAVALRLYRFLTQPGPGKTIPNTSVREEHLKQVMQFLQHRVAMAEKDGKPVKRLKRIVDFLTRPGETMVVGVNVEQLQKFMHFLKQQGQPAEPSMSPQTLPPAMEQAMQQLTEVVRQLAKQLENTQKNDDKTTPSSDWFSEFLE